MGWFWGARGPQQPPSSSAPDPAQSPTEPVPAPAQAAHTPNKPSAPTVDEESEMREFLREVMGEVKTMRDADAAASRQVEAAASSSTTTKNRKLPISPWGSSWANSSMSGGSPPNHQQDPSTATWPAAFSDEPSPPPNNAPRLSPLAESLLPTTMNCQTSFDLAFHCRSLKGQFNAIYRYGSTRSCNEHWDDFWFCMRAKGFGEGKVKEDAIRDHYRQKELAKYGPGKPSSEDVWRERKERLGPGDAFMMPVEATKLGDAEYQRWEMERMERIRKGLSDTEHS